MKHRFYPYRPYLKAFARDLRNNPTPVERRLWQDLKGKFQGRYDFHRQKPLDRFIADFFCKDLQLVIELDGPIHQQPVKKEIDFEKEKSLNKLGLNVLRIQNEEVENNTEWVISLISLYISAFETSDFSRFNGPLNVITGIVPILNNKV